MKVRLAVLEDLERINNLFDEVIDNMYKESITIWNKYYPYKKFSKDIKSNNLYLKNGFNMVNGIHKEYISEDDYLEEYGFEMKVY